MGICVNRCRVVTVTTNVFFRFNVGSFVSVLLITFLLCCICGLVGTSNSVGIFANVLILVLV